MKDAAVCTSLPGDSTEPSAGRDVTLTSGTLADGTLTGKTSGTGALVARGGEACPAEGALAPKPVANGSTRGPAAPPARSEAASGVGEPPPELASSPNGQPRNVLLRQGAPSAAELAVDWSSAVLQASLRVVARPLLSGAWQATVRVAGVEKLAAGAWSEVCRHHDAKCDYLELEQPLEDGWKLVRQMLLARRDRFLLLADSAVGPPDARVPIEYQLHWPLAEGVACAWAEESWEGWLVRGKQRQASVLPLELPEWRAAWEDAALASTDGRLHLRQTARGRALCAPLWFDLDRKRLRRALTWRRLTVGENLAVVPRDEAVGYRVQVGREQWLIYNSLAPVGNRSVLGLNTCAALVCGRFLPSGKIEEIVVIE